MGVQIVNETGAAHRAGENPATPTLIYCAAGNQRYADIALKHGFRYGAQLPHTVYHTPYFVDQNWKKPDFNRYMVALEKHKPVVATVLD